MSVTEFGIVFVTLLAVGSILILLLTSFAKLNTINRVGFSLIGSGLLMHLGTMLDDHSPFADWTTIIARVGVIVVVLGYVYNYYAFKERDFND